MKKQKKKKKEKKRRRKYLLPGIELGNFYAPVRFATTTPLLKFPDDISLLVKLSPRTSAGAPFIKLIEPY